MAEKHGDFIADHISIHQDFGRRKTDSDIAPKLLEVADWIGKTKAFYAGDVATFRTIANFLRNEATGRRDN